MSEAERDAKGGGGTPQHEDGAPGPGDGGPAQKAAAGHAPQAEGLPRGCSPPQPGPGTVDRIQGHSGPYASQGFPGHPAYQPHDQPQYPPQYWHQHPPQFWPQYAPQAYPQQAANGQAGYGYPYPSAPMETAMPAAAGAAGHPYMGYPPPGFAAQAMGGMPGQGAPMPGYAPGPVPGAAGAGPHAGVGQGPGPQAGMQQLFDEIAQGGNGLNSLTRMLSLDDSEFWKGALVGAAAVLLLTNDQVQDALFKSGAKAKSAVKSGADKLKERASAAPETGDES